MKFLLTTLSVIILISGILLPAEKHLYNEHWSEQLTEIIPVTVGPWLDVIIHQDGAVTSINISNYGEEVEIDPQDGAVYIMSLGSNDEVIGVTIDGFYVSDGNGGYIGWQYNNSIEKRWSLYRAGSYYSGYVDNDDKGEEIIVDGPAWREFGSILKLTLPHHYIAGVGCAQYYVGFNLEVIDSNLPDTEAPLTLYFYIVFYPEVSL